MVHEFALGTAETYDSHGEEMRKMMSGGMMTTRSINHDKMREAGMMHDEPNSVLLELGETGKIIWTFDGHAPVEVACNLPGHRQAGMKASVVATEKRASR